jgi:cytochrome c oxidase subunit I+III
VEHAQAPPPPHNFDALPVVHGREPLWTQRRSPRTSAGLAADAQGSAGDQRARRAQPESRPLFPKPSAWPFLGALATTVLFIGSVYTPWAVVWGAVPVTIGADRLVLAEDRKETEQALALEKSSMTAGALRTPAAMCSTCAGCPATPSARAA